MPELDMSDALLEPVLQDDFAVIRRAETITDKGRSTTAPKTYQAFGVITADSPNDLIRGQDEEHDTKSISIVTQFKLQQAAKGYQPDLILWAGNYYVVNHIDDYSRYGDGFIQATATSIDYVDEPPLGQR